ncbi:MAG: HAD family phosphatase [Synergistes sp.]|nr:HAD family phosphatase [Synergistes sp.]
MRPYWSLSAAGGFLLDWDGVIADTKLDFSGIREKYYGGRRAMLLEEAHTLPPEKQEELNRDLIELEMAGADRATAVPGAFSLISLLQENDIPFCILSRNCMDVIRRGAEVIGLELPEHHVWGRDNMEYLKPDPRALTSAAEKTGAPAHSCIYVGDFLYDLQGARRAGMRGVLVQRDEREWECWADVIFPKMTDLVKAFEEKKEYIPWEYRELYAAKGAAWLERACSCTFALPEDPLPDAASWLLRAAELGIGSFSVSAERVFSPGDWKASPSFDTASMGFTWAETVSSFIAPRFPQVTVMSSGASALPAPADASALDDYIAGIVRGNG